MKLFHIARPKGLNIQDDGFYGRDPVQLDVQCFTKVFFVTSLGKLLDEWHMSFN